MTGRAARAAVRLRIVDAGRRAAEGDSGSATNPSVACRSGVARRRRTVVEVVRSVIYTRRRAAAPEVRCTRFAPAGCTKRSNGLAIGSALKIGESR